MSADATSSAPQTVNELEPRTKLRGTVKNIELFGAFVDIGIGKNALLHISQLGKPDVRNVEDVVKEGDEIDVYVLRVDKEGNRVFLSLVQPPALTWEELKENDVVTGKIVRVEAFGVFVDFGAERPGMVHVSELTNGFVKSPSDVVNVGDEVQARILKINRKKRQIDMTMKTLEPEVEEIYEEEPEEEVPTAMELALRKAMAAQKGSEAERASRKAAKAERYRNEQEEIISRTLREQIN
jgi:small subunit ribosomal protein S1